MYQASKEFVSVAVNGLTGYLLVLVDSISIILFVDLYSRSPAVPGLQVLCRVHPGRLQKNGNQG